MNIIEAIESEKFFGKIFKDQDSWQNWKIFLKAIYGIPLKQDETVLYSKFTGQVGINLRGYEEAYVLAGRRGGKSFIASIIACYEALFHDWSDNLNAGERGHIFLIATDRQQAKVMFRYIRGILENFEDEIERETQEEIQLKNNITISVKTASWRGGRGFSTCCILCDELAFWRSEESAVPAEEVINSLLPSLLPGGKLIGISTPYGRMGTLYEIYQKYYGKNDPDILVWKAPTRAMNPTYKKSMIDRLLRRNKSAMYAEFEAEFRADIESFLTEEQLQICTMKGCTILAPLAGNRYKAFVDCSGGRRDSFTMSIAHVLNNRVIEDYTIETKAPFDPKQVVESYSEILKNYGIHEVLGDNFAANWASGTWKRSGLTYKITKYSKSDLFGIFGNVVAMQQCQLLDSERARLQFRSLERHTGKTGSDSIQKPTNSHDDVANSIAGAIVSNYADIEQRATALDLINRMPVHAGNPKPVLVDKNRNIEQEVLRELREEGIL